MYKGTLTQVRHVNWRLAHHRDDVWSRGRLQHAAPWLCMNHSIISWLVNWATHSYNTAATLQGLKPAKWQQQLLHFLCCFVFSVSVSVVLTFSSMLCWKRECVCVVWICRHCLFVSIDSDALYYWKWLNDLQSKNVEINYFQVSTVFITITVC